MQHPKSKIYANFAMIEKIYPLLKFPLEFVLMSDMMFDLTLPTVCN